MNKFITVKGVGHVSAKPDLIILSLEMETLHVNYANCVSHAAKDTDELRNALIKIGFEKDCLKTKKFCVEAKYHDEKIQGSNQYKEVFDAWNCNHSMELRLPLDIEHLGKVIFAITNITHPPKLDIDFAIDDATAIREELLVNATQNARDKAAVLCRASGVKLGQLIKIDYNWDEINLYSSTDCNMDYMSSSSSIGSISSMHIDPDDIKVNDTATFVWEIITDNANN